MKRPKRRDWKRIVAMLAGSPEGKPEGRPAGVDGKRIEAVGCVSQSLPVAIRRNVKFGST